MAASLSCRMRLSQACQLLRGSVGVCSAAPRRIQLSRSHARRRQGDLGSNPLQQQQQWGCGHQRSSSSNSSSSSSSADGSSSQDWADNPSSAAAFSARLRNPEYRAQVEAFRELVTPDALPILQENLSVEDLQQLQTILLDMRYLDTHGDAGGVGRSVGSGGRANAVEGGQQGPSDDSGGSMGPRSDDEGDRLGSPSRSPAGQAAGSEEAGPSGRSSSYRIRNTIRPTLDQMYVMQEARIAVQQMPSDFQSYLVQLLDGASPEQLEGVIEMMGPHHLAKLESLYQEILSFAQCPLEDLPTKYIQTCNKMEQLQQELMQAPATEDSGAGISGIATDSSSSDVAAQTAGVLSNEDLETFSGRLQGRGNGQWPSAAETLASVGPGRPADADQSQDEGPQQQQQAGAPARKFFQGTGKQAGRARKPGARQRGSLFRAPT